VPSNPRQAQVSPVHGRPSHVTRILDPTQTRIKFRPPTCRLEPSSSSKREFNASTPISTPIALLAYSPPTQFIPESSLSLPHNPFSNPSFSELHLLAIQDPLQSAFCWCRVIHRHIWRVFICATRNLDMKMKREVVPIASPSKWSPPGSRCLRISLYLHLYLHPELLWHPHPHPTRYRYSITVFPPCRVSLPAAIPHHHQDTRSTERYHAYHR